MITAPTVSCLQQLNTDVPHVIQHLSANEDVLSATRYIRGIAWNLSTAIKVARVTGHQANVLALRAIYADFPPTVTGMMEVQA